MSDIKSTTYHTNRKVFSAFVFNGLGDRMMDVIGLGALSRYFNIPYNNMIAYWAIDAKAFAWGNALYDTRLFDFSTVCTVLPHNPHGSSITYTLLNKNAACTFSPIKLLNYLVFQQKYGVKYGNVCKAYIDSGTSIRPSLQLQKCLFDTTKYIAIHLRRTDKINSRGDSRHETSSHEYDVITQRMLAYIEECIKQGERFFYILSDDASYKTIFANMMYEIGRRNNVMLTILLLNQDIIQQHVKAIEPSIIEYKGLFDVYEWFCMSQCKKIIQGIKYSTFSMSSSMVRHTPLVNFSDFNITHLLNTWMPCLNLSLPYVQSQTPIQEVMKAMHIMWAPLIL